LSRASRFDAPVQLRINQLAKKIFGIGIAIANGE
jgi:hypothetical protein